MPQVAIALSTVWGAARGAFGDSGGTGKLTVYAKKACVVNGSMFEMGLRWRCFHCVVAVL